MHARVYTPPHEPDSLSELECDKLKARILLTFLCSFQENSQAEAFHDQFKVMLIEELNKIKPPTGECCLLQTREGIGKVYPDCVFPVL